MIAIPHDLALLHVRAATSRMYRPLRRYDRSSRHRKQQSISSSGACAAQLARRQCMLQASVRPLGRCTGACVRTSSIYPRIHCVRGLCFRVSHFPETGIPTPMPANVSGGTRRPGAKDAPAAAPAGPPAAARPAHVVGTTRAYDGRGADERVRQPTTTAGGLDTCARM